jgi:biopolymer transport protein TolQ
MAVRPACQKPGARAWRRIFFEGVVVKMKWFMALALMVVGIGTAAAQTADQSADQAVNAAPLAPAGANLSLWNLFLEADIVVKLVMLILLLASVWVWAIIIEKSITLRRVNKEANVFEDSFWSGGSLDDLYDREGADPTNPIAAVFGAAMSEWRRTVRIAGVDIGHTAVRERVDRAMNVTTMREMDRLERYMIFLASVGSTAPFVGLFGTVWGIMHSFSAIAAMHNTDLAVVAPGIAEALFATAIGLVAAIPAVLAYNKISNDLARFAARLEGFGSEFSAILSRQTEEKA